MIINYLKLFVNLNNDTALIYVLNKPSRKIGKETEKKIIDISKKFKQSYFSAISFILNNQDNKYNLKKETKNSLKSFYDLANKFSRSIEKKSANAIINELIGDINLKDEFKNKESDIRNLKSFLEKVEGWEKDCEINNTNIFTVPLLLENISLFVDINDIDNINNNDEKNIMKSNCVKLMTIHSAKGLEFTNIFIVGVEEGYYPSLSEYYDLSDDDLEEERRVFYVALTRAKENCFISYCKRRKMKDEFRNRNISKFVSDIPVIYTEMYNDNNYIYIPNSVRKKEKQENLENSNNEREINEIKNSISFIYENKFINEKNDNEKNKIIIENPIVRKEENKENRKIEINEILSSNNINIKEDNEIICDNNKPKKEKEKEKNIKIYKKPRVKKEKDKDKKDESLDINITNNIKEDSNDILKKEKTTNKKHLGNKRLLKGQIQMDYFLLNKNK